MDMKMYYCKHWEHKTFEFEGQQYEICISDKINGNEIGSTIQFHGVVIANNDVPTIGSLNSNISEKEAQTRLNDFELDVRNVLRDNLEWIDMKPDNQVVKIWYYTKGEDLKNDKKVDKRKYPPLRFAVTVVNIKPLNKKLSKKVRHELESTIISWVSLILTI